MLTDGQKRALHSAARELGLADPDRHNIQRNIGGFFSAADRTATRQGFIAVMAFYESLAGGRLSGSQPGYWQGQDAQANPTDSLVYRIRREAAALGWTDEGTNTFLASTHMSSGACTDLASASAYWLRRTLQAMIQMRERLQQTGSREAAPAT
jgi:hypothetical protein